MQALLQKLRLSYPHERWSDQSRVGPGPIPRAGVARCSWSCCEPLTTAPMPGEGEGHAASIALRMLHAVAVPGPAAARERARRHLRRASESFADDAMRCEVRADPTLCFAQRLHRLERANPACAGAKGRRKRSHPAVVYVCQCCAASSDMASMASCRLARVV